MAGQGSHHGGLELQRDGTQSVLQQPLACDVQDQRLGGLRELADVPPQHLQERCCGAGADPARPWVLWKPGSCFVCACARPFPCPLPSTCPSVEAEKHSVPVLDCSQIAPYAGSRWLASTVDTSTGSPPFLVSQ